MALNTFSDKKPIQYFKIYLIVSTTLGGLLMYSTMGNDLQYYSPFTLVMLIWHIMTIIGICSKYKWGFYLFKFYLIVLYIGFPIGTYIAKRYFDYIKEHEIERRYA